MEQEKIVYNVLIISLQISCTLFLCLTTVPLIDWHSPPEVWGPSDGMQSKRWTKHSAFPLNSSLQALNSIRLQPFGGKNINKNWLFFIEINKKLQVEWQSDKLLHRSRNGFSRFNCHFQLPPLNCKTSVQ